MKPPVSYTKSESPSEIETSDVAVRLRLAVARLQRLIRQQATGNLNLAEASCLAIIDRHGPLSLTEWLHAKVSQRQRSPRSWRGSKVKA